MSPLWKPPILSVCGHRLHFCIYVRTPSKTQRTDADQPMNGGLVCAVSLFGLRAEMGENA